ncbi:MAG: excinuclease ABC subunit UvrC [Chloroflexi bacterium]|nr:excinuclease ABC subunit UvrC [Chloroflexota bacterium]
MRRSSAAVVPTDFSDRLRATPAKPGVYIMRGRSGAVLYVGKAAKLRNRLRSYFAKKANHPPKIREMVRRVAEFEYIVAESEQEALLLECNLIKQNKPPYNARLKDDKSYPFIKVDLTEDFPQVYITRTVKRDGSRYFGPFASASSVRRTLALLKKLFPYRSCTKTITGNDPRPCLDYYINRCVGPCIGAVDKEQYREVIERVFLFLDGKADRILKSLEARMLDASEELEFERAATLRDQIQAIEKVHEGQKVLHLSSETLDLIALASDGDEAWMEVFFVRQGKLVGRDHFIMTSTQDDTPGEILSAFVKQFYEVNPYVPPRILVQDELVDTDAIEGWLGEKRRSKVRIYVPQRGEKRRLMRMVAENASEGMEQRRVQAAAEEGALGRAMEELQESLNLPTLPRRMECYDISNTQGSNPVGSMVVFEEGKPKSSDYRKFQIKGVDGVDDYSMMREMLTRRFRRLADPKAQVADVDDGSNGESKGQAWQQAPDLVLIDGGKGHLGAALQVFLELGITSIPLASLAKENEELFVPQTPEPIVLARTSPALFLVQRLRDEAHRFAITYHRQRRSKKSTTSALDHVPGIGPKRRQMLIRQFGSVQGVREATLEDVAAVPGMTLTLASKVKEWL